MWNTRLSPPPLIVSALNHTEAVIAVNDLERPVLFRLSFTQSKS